MDGVAHFLRSVGGLFFSLGVKIAQLLGELVQTGVDRTQGGGGQLGHAAQTAEIFLMLQQLIFLLPTLGCHRGAALRMATLQFRQTGFPFFLQ